jgi:hypothetical protein
LKPLEPAFNPGVDEVLAYFLSLFMCNFSCFLLIPVQKLLAVLLHNLPTIFDRYKVWRIWTIEEVIQLVLTLLFDNNVVFGVFSMPRIIVFLQDKRSLPRILKLWFVNRFRYLIAINLKTEFAIAFFRSLVKARLLLKL